MGEIRGALDQIGKGKQKSYTKKQVKQAKDELARLKAKAKALSKKDAAHDLLPRIKEVKASLREMKLANEGRVSIKVAHKEFRIKKSYLERLTDPDAYVKKLYVNTTIKNVNKLRKEGREVEAIGLLRLAKPFDYKEDEISRLQESMNAPSIGGEYEWLDDLSMNILQGGSAIDEDVSGSAVITTVAGNQIRLDVV